jgi:hypothetical protein
LERRNADVDYISWNTCSATIPIIPKILDKDGHWLPWRIVEKLGMKTQRVFETASNVPDNILVAF